VFCETGQRRAEGTALTNLANALHEIRSFGEAITGRQDVITTDR
jgi:hypothetical protein